MFRKWLVAVLRGILERAEERPVSDRETEVARKMKFLEEFEFLVKILLWRLIAEAQTLENAVLELGEAGQWRWTLT